MSDQFNFFEEKPLSEVTLSELDGLVQRLFDKKKEIEADEELLDAKKAELELLKETVKSILVETNHTQFLSPNGMVHTRTRFQVTVPKDSDNLRLLQEYYISRGMRDQLKPNHNSFNSFFDSVVEEKKELGEPIDMKNIIPGVDEPKASLVLVMKKGK